MGSEKEFLQKLKELLDIAAVSGNRITTEEVGAFFGDSELSEEQMLLVYDYLLTQKISVVGYMKGCLLYTSCPAVFRSTAGWKGDRSRGLRTDGISFICVQL